MKYQKLNILFGWITFAISAFVYISTIEPTASFWDCGEFIATGYKLEVGHPPGAPVFMLLTRFFSLFAGGNVQNVAMMVNIMSALASAFTILFLFWTITHLSKKVIGTANGNYTLGQTIAIIGSGLVGSLAYTFSDTFWFSAVEGEVYATSSLITAIVFWAILKWENIADEKNADRWIILIAYVVGLSIGVHLLNLLAIPAIVLVYYFRKYNPTTKGVILSLLLSGIMLAFIMWGVVPGVVKLAFLFDLLFVNVFGLPFNIGELFFVIAAFALLTWLIYYTRKKMMPVLNAIVTAFAVIMIGYSSYAIIVVRSLATPPIDQNNPEDAFSLLGYLNREQYGQTPLITGPYYNAPVNISDPYKIGRNTWMRENGKYVKGEPKISYNYNKAMTTFFPRMYSSKPEHIDDYKMWANIKGRKVKVMNNQGQMETIVKPTFSENLKFFFRYQIGHMYMRYFMWNFSGRQNDIQGHGGVLNGNWVTGINFIDEARLGPQDNLPSGYANNRANNKYYMLPFFLGLIGLFFHLSKNKRDFWIVMSLFVLTGLAIVVYLNQYPHQPRERDYAYAGSFYAYCIWIGLGVLGIYNAIKKYLNEVPGAVTATVVTLFIPALMAAENWDDHDRSGRYIARDFAYNYLNSVAPNGVIFTNGDNDTFPLWYIQEVEGVRTDVRVICLPYLITDWYIDQMKMKYYESEPVPFSYNKNQYILGKRDQVPVYERMKEHVELKDVIEFVGSDDDRTKLQTNMGEKTDYFPTKAFKITVDKNKVIEKGVVNPRFADKIVDEISWNINANYIMKNDLMILDLLASANWERPIYFVSVGGNEINLRDYFQVEGFASRFVPINTKFDYKTVGHVDSDILYNNLMNKFRWGNMGDPKVYLDENIRRTIRIVRVRNNFGLLAKTLATEGKLDSAQQVMLRCLDILPLEKLNLEYFDNEFIEAFFAAGMEEKGTQIALDMAKTAVDDMEYFVNISKKFGNVAEYDKQLAFTTVQWLNELARNYKQTELSTQLNKYYEDIYNLVISSGM